MLVRPIPTFQNYDRAQEIVSNNLTNFACNINRLESKYPSSNIAVSRDIYNNKYFDNIYNNNNNNSSKFYKNYICNDGNYTINNNNINNVNTDSSILAINNSLKEIVANQTAVSGNCVPAMKRFVRRVPRTFCPVILQHNTDYIQKPELPSDPIQHQTQVGSISAREHYDSKYKTCFHETYRNRESDINGSENVRRKKIFQLQLSIAESLEDAHKLPSFGYYNNYSIDKETRQNQAEAFVTHVHDAMYRNIDSEITRWKTRDYRGSPPSFGRSKDGDDHNNNNNNNSRIHGVPFDLHHPTYRLSSSSEPKLSLDSSKVYQSWQPYQNSSNRWDQLPNLNLLPKPFLLESLKNEPCFANHHPFYSEDFRYAHWNTDPYDPSNDRSHVNMFSKQDDTKFTERKVNMCPYCYKLNSSPAQLKVHLRIHTGERPYVCGNDGCDKTFARNEELTRHLRIHTGDRPYTCKLCQRRFGRKDHLRKHEITHRSVSDKKVYICLISGCKQRYTRSDALARHRWNAHYIRPQIKNIRISKNGIRKPVPKKAEPSLPRNLTESVF